MPSLKPLFIIFQQKARFLLEGSLMKKILFPFEILRAAFKKFLLDEGFTKSSAIAYTAIMSMVPAMAVILSFVSFARRGDANDFFRELSLFLSQHNIRLNIDPVVHAVTSLVSNAGKVGSIGAIAMIFSATAMLRAVEESLNKIFNAKRNRSLFIRLVYYWSALTLGPILFAAGITVANQVSELLTSPSYNAVVITEEGITVAGSKSAILHKPADSKEFQTYDLTRLDPDELITYSFDEKGRSFRVTGKSGSFKMIKNRFSGMVTYKDTHALVSDKGYLVEMPRDLSKPKAMRFQGMSITDIVRNNEGIIFMSCSKGSILRGETLEGPWKRVEIAPFNITLKSIAFMGQKGIAVGTGGTVAVTRNNGVDWKVSQIEEARVNGRLVDLNHVTIHSRGKVLITGDDGLILLAYHFGGRWKKRNFLETSYLTGFIGEKNLLRAGGRKGLFIESSDNGLTWTKTYLPTPAVTSITMEDDRLWVTGQNGLIYHRDGTQWQGVHGSRCIVFILNFFAPFIFIWIFFLALYMTMPNRKVPLKDAAAGSAFTSTVLVIFILGFLVYARSFADTTFAIYGALAAIPLFLLMIYSSALIFLLGGEVTSVSMNPGKYIISKENITEQKTGQLFIMLQILVSVYSSFEKGRGSVAREDIPKPESLDALEMHQAIDLLAEKELIAYDSGKKLIPGGTSSSVEIGSLLAIMEEPVYGIPDDAENRGLVKVVTAFTDKLTESRNDVLKQMTLKDVIKKVNAHRTK